MSELSRQTKRFLEDAILTGMSKPFCPGISTSHFKQAQEKLLAMQRQIRANAKI